MYMYMYIWVVGYDELLFNALQGELFMEATQVFSPWVYQSVRIYHGLPFVEFEYTVGPIPNR